MTDVKLKKIHEDAVIGTITEFINDRVEKFDYDGAIVGISGGIDSSVTAKLAARAFEGTGREVLGVSLPAHENVPKYAQLFEEENEDHPNMSFREIHIDPIRDCFRRTALIDGQINPYDRGNMTARIRANILNTLGAQSNYIVLGTGNRDEAWLGYYTLFGDAAAHAMPIGNVPKRGVWKLGEHLGVHPDIIRREPTDGLQEDKTDKGDLGFSYKNAELVREALKQNIDPKSIKNNDSWPIKVEQILERAKEGEQKAEIIHPPAPRLMMNYK